MGDEKDFNIFRTGKSKSNKGRKAPLIGRDIEKSPDRPQEPHDTRHDPNGLKRLRTVKNVREYAPTITERFDIVGTLNVPADKTTLDVISKIDTAIRRNRHGNPILKDQKIAPVKNTVIVNTLFTILDEALVLKLGPQWEEHFPGDIIGQEDLEVWLDSFFNK